MNIAYLRVSTNKQELENQKREILLYCNKKSLTDVRFFEETKSTRKKLEERFLYKLITEILKEDDVLIVSELSRLGRSVPEVFRIFELLSQKNVQVHIVKGGIIIGDKENKLMNRVLVFAFGLAAEIERELISMRTKEALARKKEQGVKLGRKQGSYKSKLDGKEKEIKKMLEKGISVNQIAKYFGVYPNTINHFIKTRGLKKN